MSDVEVTVHFHNGESIREPISESKWALLQERILTIRNGIWLQIGDTLVHSQSVSAFVKDEEES